MSSHAAQEKGLDFLVLEVLRRAISGAKNDADDPKQPPSSSLGSNFSVTPVSLPAVVDITGDEEDGNGTNRSLDPCSRWLKSGCRYRCHYCGDVAGGNSKSFWFHVKQRHRLDKEEYETLHGEGSHVQRRVDVTCAICRETFDHDEWFLKRHFQVGFNLP